jgi:hypothetical protein
LQKHNLVAKLQVGDWGCVKLGWWVIRTFVQLQ